MNTIMAAASRLRRRRQASARVWLQFLGYLASLVDVLPDCRLHMRPLQIHLLRHYCPSRDLLTRLVPIPPPIRLHLVRWSRRDFLSSGNPLRVAQPSITVTTDASLLGWGGHCLGNAASGDWPRADTLSHINLLEFRVVLLSLRSFLPLLRRRIVLIRTDNVTVAAYKQAGGHALHQTECPSGSSVEVVQTRGSFSHSVPHPGPGQSHSRLPVPGPSPAL